MRLPGSKRKKEIERRIANAKKAIVTVFVDSIKNEAAVPPGDEAIDLMNECVEMIAYDYIEKASIILPGGIKANISRNKGAIKVERVETIKSSREAS